VESFVSRVITRFTHRYCRCADWAGRAWNRIVNRPTYRNRFFKKVATFVGLLEATDVGRQLRGLRRAIRYYPLRSMSRDRSFRSRSLSVLHAPSQIIRRSLKRDTVISRVRSTCRASISAVTFSERILRRS
jgi:hypothetical protein